MIVPSCHPHPFEGIQAQVSVVYCSPGVEDSEGVENLGLRGRADVEEERMGVSHRLEGAVSYAH